MKTNEFKKGDVVECMQTFQGYVTKGKAYVVKDTDICFDNALIRIKCDSGIEGLFDAGYFTKVEKTPKPGFDWFNKCWYVPVTYPDHAFAVVEYLQNLGYKFESGVTPKSLPKNITCITNTYKKGIPDKYLMYSTDANLKRQETVFGSIRVDLIPEYVCKIVDVKIPNENQEKIMDIEKQIEELNKKLKELKG